MCKLKRIMSIQNNPERIERFIEYAKSLGCSVDSLWNPDGKFREDLIITRIIEAKRAQRESALWLFALISALASVLSALAAWKVVFHK